MSKVSVKIEQYTELSPASSSKTSVHSTVPGRKRKSTIKIKKKIEPTVSKVKFVPVRVKEIDKHRHNIRTILLTSNATPVKCIGSDYECSFCEKKFSLPADLKTHILETHETVKREYMKGQLLNAYVVKLDVTDLKCGLCPSKMDEDLERFIDHIQKQHSYIYHTDINNHILPFKFKEDLLFCAACSTKFVNFKMLHQHMGVHYRNYVCNICDIAFVTDHSLKEHSRRHLRSESKCPECDKTFDSELKRNNHVKAVHILKQKRNKCAHCDERFSCYGSKAKHMLKVHGVERKLYKCDACDCTYTRAATLSQHKRRVHLLEREIPCDLCDKKFFKRSILAKHMVCHTGEKQYQCEVCTKSFARKGTLREHLRIHANDRRFVCIHCDMGFVQKCSLKSHIRNRHKDVDDHERSDHDFQTAFMSSLPNA